MVRMDARAGRILRETNIETGSIHAEYVPRCDEDDDDWTLYSHHQQTCHPRTGEQTEQGQNIVRKLVQFNFNQ